LEQTGGKSVSKKPYGVVWSSQERKGKKLLWPMRIVPVAGSSKPLDDAGKKPAPFKQVLSV